MWKENVWIASCASCVRRAELNHMESKSNPRQLSSYGTINHNFWMSATALEPFAHATAAQKQIFGHKLNKFPLLPPLSRLLLAKKCPEFFILYATCRKKIWKDFRKSRQARARCDKKEYLLKKWTVTTYCLHQSDMNNRKCQYSDACWGMKAPPVHRGWKYIWHSSFLNVSKGAHCVKSSLFLASVTLTWVCLNVLMNASVRKDLSGNTQVHVS